MASALGQSAAAELAMGPEGTCAADVACSPVDDSGYGFSYFYMAMMVAMILLCFVTLGIFVFRFFNDPMRNYEVDEPEPELNVADASSEVVQDEVVPEPIAMPHSPTNDSDDSEDDIEETEEDRRARYNASSLSECSDPEYWVELHHLDSEDDSPTEEDGEASPTELGENRFAAIAAIRTRINEAYDNGDAAAVAYWERQEDMLTYL